MRQLNSYINNFLKTQFALTLQEILLHRCASGNVGGPRVRTYGSLSEDAAPSASSSFVPADVFFAGARQSAAGPSECFRGPVQQGLASGEYAETKVESASSSPEQVFDEDH